ncbi:hypothetical protein G7Y89_g8383 [Cudoniella acicularis]|uniref:Uncharacterized protein n=1 Tax=Cudoniella acicularis TaxID=354080 RepID=A0A8H4RGN4_9HELO|nr:hypothetical protein G7Y89_g8383 [Cudoniella acicularis]
MSFNITVATTSSSSSSSSPPPTSFSTISTSDPSYTPPSSIASTPSTGSSGSSTSASSSTSVNSILSSSGTSTTSTGNTSQTSSSKATSSKGVSAGGAAGLAIGFAILGALIAGLIVFVLLRRKKEQTNYPQSHLPFEGQSPIENEKNGIVAAAVPAHGNVDRFLPQPAEDDAIVGGLSKIRDGIKNHVQNYYHDLPIDPDAINEGPLAELSTATATPTSALKTLLLNPASRKPTLQLFLAQLILSRCTVRTDRHLSFLPREVSGLAVSPTSSGGTRSPQLALLSKWKTISGALLQQQYGQPLTENDPRNTAITQALAEADSILLPFVDSSVHTAGRGRNLDGIMRRAAQFAFLLFSQPSSFQFDYAGTGQANSLVVFPALLQTVNDEAEAVSPPRVLSAKEIMNGLGVSLWKFIKVAAAIRARRAFSVAEYAVKLHAVGSEHGVFVRLILRVRNDLEEVERLLSAPEVRNKLLDTPGKLPWIKDVILTTKTALNEIGRWVERARVDKEEYGSVSFDNRVRWVFNDHDKLTNRTLELNTNHLALSNVLTYLMPLEQSDALMDEGLPEYEDVTGFEDFLSPRQKRKLRHTDSRAEQGTNSEVTSSESHKRAFSSTSTTSLPTLRDEIGNMGRIPGDGDARPVLNSSSSQSLPRTSATERGSTSSLPQSFNHSSSSTSLTTRASLSSFPGSTIQESSSKHDDIPSNPRRKSGPLFTIARRPVSPLSRASSIWSPMTTEPSLASPAPSWPYTNRTVSDEQREPPISTPSTETRRSRSSTLASTQDWDIDKPINSNVPQTQSTDHLPQPAPWNTQHTPSKPAQSPQEPSADFQITPNDELRTSMPQPGPSQQPVQQKFSGNNSFGPIDPFRYSPDSSTPSNSIAELSAEPKKPQLSKPKITKLTNVAYRPPLSPDPPISPPIPPKIPRKSVPEADSDVDVLKWKEIQREDSPRGHLSLEKFPRSLKWLLRF